MEKYREEITRDEVIEELEDLLLYIQADEDDLCSSYDILIMVKSYIVNTIRWLKEEE